MSEVPAGPGFLAVSAPAGALPSRVAEALRGIAPVAASREDGTASLQVVTWGTRHRLVDGEVLLLGRPARRRDHAVDELEVGRYLGLGASHDDTALSQMLPSFAAAARRGEEILACTDALGMRHLYTAAREGWAAVSTSARALAALVGEGTDAEALAVQAVLGWQLGDRTLFTGVTKVPAGTRVRLRLGRLALSSFTSSPPPGSVGLDLAVDTTRDMLRDYLDALLQDVPDPVLQLTGGQDSRLLLSAIEPSRRRGLRAMTLGSSDSPDVRLAAELARAHGLHHEVLGLDAIAILDPAEAWEWCRQGAARLECMADPVARAALDVAEADAQPGTRLSGLGGEVARGFYYLGRGAGPVTDRRTRRLVDWRMFANESVAPEMLDPAFSSWARDFAAGEVERLLRSGGEPWFDATDRLYLEQRMQRWAGVTETAMSGSRDVVNPMLDDRFIATARALRPQDKRGSRFLGRLQVALDPQLAAVPLDHRPPPATYAAGGAAHVLAEARSTAVRVARKLEQRARGRRRPPVGGPVLADLVVRHWRTDPSVLDGLAGHPTLDVGWVERLVAGRTQADPSAVALVSNLVVAGQTTRGAPVESRV